MHPYLTTAAASFAGLAVWTATEYTAHRTSLHPSPKSLWSSLRVDREHRAHHEDPMRTSPALRVVGYAAIGATAAVFSRVSRPRLGVATATGLSTGWALGYATYEWFHWQMHHVAPRTDWGLRMRRRHFRHHFGGPQSNFGVTMPWWDQLMGTEADTGPARLAARRAPQWMTDEFGNLHGEFGDDFVLVHG